MEPLADRIDALSQGRAFWKPEDIARAGAIVGIGARRQAHGGARPCAARGHRRSRSRGKRGKRRSRQGEGHAEHGGRRAFRRARRGPDRAPHRRASRQPRGRPEYGARRRGACARPAVVLWPRRGKSCLSLRLDSPDLRGSAEGIEDSPAAGKLAEQHALLAQALARGRARPVGMVPRAGRADAASRFSPIARPVRSTRSQGRTNGATNAVAHADQLAAALSLDMAQWWQPTAASYLGRVTKARILEAVAKASRRRRRRTSPSLKKDALVERAEERLAGQGLASRPASPVR